VLTDNVTELTASANDDGWEPIFVNWMSSLDFGVEDILLVFSVGGGMRSKVTGELVSGGIACAVMQAKALGARVLGVVGNPVGVTAEMADLCLLVRSPVAEYVTPVTEAVQSVVWHCLVTDSRLQRRPTKW
jgi:D-sedoheptulose 7-phosphate isomerase